MEDATGREKKGNKGPGVGSDGVAPATASPAATAHGKKGKGEKGEGKGAWAVEATIVLRMRFLPGPRPFLLSPTFSAWPISLGLRQPSLQRSAIPRHAFEARAALRAEDSDTREKR